MKKILKCDTCGTEARHVKSTLGGNMCMECAKVYSPTRGPWEVIHPGPVLHGKRIFARNTYIGIIDNSDMDPREIEANARLVAAAPKLYEALDTLVAVVGLTAFKYEGQCAVLQEAVDIAVEVLKKARGES